MTNNEHASTAESRSYAADSEKLHAAPIHVLTVTEAGRADTFAIHVADQHEYYANGILVKTCYDAFRYGIMAAANRRVLRTW